MKSNGCELNLEDKSKLIVAQNIVAQLKQQQNKLEKY